eukprot:CAMPEP_0183337626 /NCGR_PEP_ID=MMETSP0164_2-20130417/5195_1 /TAXON_ID=221442 /ORGANISM="Coccolithus pelagicus ssp braarudi, Strain PLY182g" /LENGTH=58 /DNA_ID=CAMNT_0025507343 /DNA_START=346 /DNA_END=522 /DNA_ORIENTATION=-
MPEAITQAHAASLLHALRELRGLRAAGGSTGSAPMVASDARTDEPPQVQQPELVRAVL